MRHVVITYSNHQLFIIGAVVFVVLVVLAVILLTPLKKKVFVFRNRSKYEP